MNPNRKELVEKIIAERERQLNLPGAEWDVKNSPNDWGAIAASYCLSSTSRKYTNPTSTDFEDDLIKAAAVILAALENIPNMKNENKLD